MAAAPPGAPILYPKPRAQLDYITVYWQPAPGTVSSYTITCTPISYSRTVPANFNQIELHGLSSGIEYAFSIYATNIYGNGPTRNFVPINVGKDPSDPIQIRASTASNTTAYITWNFSSIYETEAPTDHFIITAIPSTIGAAPNTTDWTFSNQKDLLMSNLSTGVTYGFLVQASNDIRYSSYKTLSNYIRIQIYWYPTQLDDIQCWYDASELKYANGQTIKSWPDRAERSFLFNPSTYGYPTVRVAGLNGLNVTTFNQLAGLQLSPLLTSTNQSFFAVARQSGGANFKVFGSYISDQYIGYFGGKKQIISLEEQPMSIGLANSDTQWDLISLVVQKTIINDFYWYGSSIETNETTNIVDSLTFNGIGNASNCEIAEVIFYNRNLITEERQVVEGYLAWKWGLYSRLPPNHPWSAYPPPVDYTTKRPPRPFTSVTVTDPTPSTFTINWLGGDSLYDIPTTYTFLINGVPTIPISVTDGVAIFGGLDPGTDYTVTIIATNKFGSTSSGPIIATTTPSQPIINSFTNVTASSITVNWTGGTGATGYIYYFNGVPITPSIDNGTTNKTATFTGLNPDTFYTIIVVAVNHGGVTPSEPFDTQLAPAVPVPQVDLNLPFSLNLSWAPCPGAQSYTYTIVPSLGVVADLTGTSIYFSNLETDTEYTITITAINGYGKSSSIPIPVTTIPADLSTILTQTTCSSFTIIWAPLASFVYSYSLVNNSISTFGTGVYTPLTISSLQPNQTYTIQVWETKSTTVIYASSLTIITYPNPTSSLSVTGINTNGFTLNWKGGDQASSFVFSVDGGTTLIRTIWSPNPYLTSQSGSAIFTNLSTGATFNDIIIYSENIGGVSFSDAYPTVTLLPSACADPTPSLFAQRTFTVNWQRPIGATSIVYGGSLQPNFTNLTIGPAVYTSLSPGTVYSTTYTPYNLNGTQAGQTTSLLVKTQADKPTDFQHSAPTLSTLFLSWSGVFGAEYYKYVINDVLSPISTSQSSITVSSISTNTDYNIAIISYVTGWPLGQITLSTYSNYTQFITQPAVPTGQKFSSVTMSSFELTWDPVPSTVYTILVGSTIFGPFTSPTTISSLIGNSTYTITLIATNPGGSTPSTMTITTGPVAPYNISTTYITDHEMLITWSGADGASSITIFYGPFSTTVAEPVNQPFRLYPLSSNTTYIITLDANSPISVTRSGSISPATGPGIASGLAASNVQNAQFTLSWSGAEGASSLLFHYNNLSTLSTPAIMSPTIIKNLSANTTYIVSIDSINPIFTTSSNQISVRTGPVPAGNISTQNITDTQIEITWTGTDGASSITIYYGPFSTTVPAPVTQPYIISPLSSNTSYIISIDATNPIFNTSSQQITSRTGPTKVSGIVASNIQNAQFTLSWSGADGASSLLFHYNNLSTLSTPAIQSPTILTNLSANTVYIVSIDAINPIFTTSSNTISVLTGPVPASNISTGNITDTTVDVYWEGTEGASSIVIHYGPDIYVFPAPVNQPVTVSSLSSNKEYIISVDAVSPIFITSSQQITTKTGPGIVTGITASNITNSQFNLAWSGAQGATSLLFRYNNLSVLSSASIPSPTLLRNLTGNTTYIVSIDAINPIFTTSSKTISVLTGPVTPYNLVQSEITNIKFLLAWSGGDGASSYTFHWGTSSLVYNAQTISNPVLISNLSTGTTYDVFIEATSPIFNAISDHYSLSTLTIIPTTAFTSITATNITDTTLLLNWTGAIHASSFYFYYAGLTVISSATTLLSTNNILVTGLTDSAIYSFYIQGVNLLSTTTSNTIIVQMGPAPATNLVISNITDTQLTVSWLGARGASTLIFYCGPLNFTFTPPNTSPYTFTGLDPYTSYPVRIDSITHIYTNPSQTQTVTTGPGQITNLTTSNVQNSQLTLAWSGGLGASSLLFTYGSQFIISSASVTSPLIITGLTPNTNYPISVQAINSTYTTPSLVINQITGPAPATNITITNIQDKQLQVNWLNAQGASSLTFRYNSQTISVNTPVTSPYTISSLQPFTSYVVSIDAVNPIFTTSSLQTTITTGPGQITNLTTSNVQNSQLTLAWSGGLGASSLQFTYGSQFIISSASVTSPLIITGLTGNTNYPISVQAINSTYTTSSLIINQITGPAPATNITITNIQDKQLQVNWLNAQGASSLTFRYNSQIISVNTPVTSPYTISSLQPFTNYIISIDAVNPIFTTSSMQTNATTGPGQITNLTTSNVQNSQLTLAWSGGLGASSLQFVYGSQFIITSGSVTSPLIITGLTGNTNYPISVQAINSTYTTSSLIINQITGPAPATNITITNIKDVQFDVNWLNAQGASSLTFRYNSQTISVNTPVASPYTITSLQPFTNYIVSIDAVNHIFTTSSMQTNATTGAYKATGLSYSDVTDTSFKVYWTGGTQGASSIQFVYNSNSVTYPISQTSPVTLTNLTGNTTYTTYINAINSTYATSSNTLVVLTGPVTPFNLTATNISNSLFKLGWSGGQGASSYTFRYNTQQLVYNATTVPNPLTIVNLSTATTYNVYIEATNSIYNAVSQVFIVSTLAVIPPLPATSIVAGSITANSFLLYWQGAENASSLTFFIGGLTPIVSSATVTSPILVTGLTQNTPYPVYIAAVNILNTANSNPITVTTAPDLPNPSLVQNTLSASTFQATWTNSSGITYGYSLNGGSAIIIGQNPTIPYTVTSLIENTFYTFTLIATNNASQSSQSSFQVTTIPSPPNATVQTINQNSFIINWTPVGSITYYYKVNGGGLINAGNPNLTVNSGIVGDTTYSFVLIASGLTTSISTNLTVLTLPVPQIPSVHDRMYGTYFQIYFSMPVGGNSYYYTMNNGGPSGGIGPYGYIQPLNPNTNYTLTLSTTNASGSSNASMNFTTGPQAPDPLYIDNVEINSFRLHWTGYHNSNNYRVYYDSDAGQRQQTTGNTNLICNENLSPSGYYGNIYIIAQNQYGFSNESVRFNVITKPLKPNPSQDLSQTNCSSLRVTWIPVGNTNYNYAFSGPGGGQNNVYPPVTLYNLPFGQTWNFQLYAVNPFNNTPIEPANITVGTAPGPATNLQFSNLSNNGTINLSWQGAQGANKAVVAYWSSFAQAANGTQYFDNFSNNGQMNNLAQNTYYSTVVSTINSYGTSNSVISSFLTYPEFTDPFSGMGISYTVQDTSISWSVGHWGYDQPYMYPGSPTQWATYWYSMDGGNTKIQGQSLSGPLSPQTTYNFTLYMKNETGFSKPSPQQSQTTTRPRPTAATILVTGASCSTLSLAWSNLQYAEAIDVYLNNSQITSGLPGGTTTYLAFGLTQATFYSNIYIRARNDAFSGSQNQSNVINGLTAALQPIQDTTQTNDSQIRMTFVVNPNNMIYTYTLTNSNGTTSPVSLSNSPFTITGLLSNTLFTLRLFNYSNSLSAVTSTIVGTGPGQETLSVVRVAYSSFTVSWTGNVGANYYIFKYNGSVPPGDPAGQVTGVSRTINTNPNTSYSVYLSEFNAYGSSFSNTVSFTTPSPPPPKPNVSQTSASDSVIQVYINNSAGGATYSFTLNGGSINPSNSNNQYFTITQGITPNQSYTLVTFGTNSSGDSDTTTTTVYSGPEKPYNLNSSSVSGGNITIRWAGAGASNFYVSFENDAIVVGGGTFSYDLNSVTGPYALSVRATKNLPNGIVGSAQSDSYSVTALLPDGVYSNKIPGSYTDGSFSGQGPTPIREFYGLTGSIVERVQFPSLIKQTLYDINGFTNINYADRQGPTCITVDLNTNILAVSNNGTLINVSGRYTLGTPGRFPGATALCVGSDGFVYIVSSNGNIYKVAPQSGNLIATKSIGPALYGVCDLDSNNVVASSGNTVYRVSKNLSDANGAWNLENNNSLRRMSKATNGNVYVAGGNQIWYINSGGQARIIDGISINGSISVGAEGCLWFGGGGGWSRLVQAAQGFLSREAYSVNGQ